MLIYIITHRVPRVSYPQFKMFFNTSSVLYQLPNHPLYKSVDWSKVGGGHYAVIDPMDDTGILYLSEKEYKIQIRVSVSQDSTLSVLARPGDKPTDPTDPSSTSSSNKPKTPQLREELGLVRRRKAVTAVSKGFSTPGYLSWFLSRLDKWRGRELLVTPTGENLLSLLLHWGLDLNVRAGGQLEPQPALNEALLELGKALRNILVTRGRTALILKMKNTLFFINRWLGGFQNDNPFLLGEPVGLARSGLPRILPLYLRRALGSKNERLTRVVLSIFKAYSALEGPHQDCDLVSVTASCPPIEQGILEEFQVFCKTVFWPKVIRKYALQSGCGHILTPTLCSRPEGRPFYPTRGGPNHSVGVLGAPLDALAWAASPRVYPREWALHVGDLRTVALFDQTLEATRAAVDLLRDNKPNEKHMKSTHFYTWDKRLFTELDVGKLAFLPEAAGKVRTIAIVDYWTQRVMKPVHDWMMKVLSVLPTDGTFDQEASLRSYVAECADSVDRHYSIDLKSATDMIPIDLYRCVLSGIWDEQTTELWIALMTDRWFRVPKANRNSVPLVVANLRGTHVEYARGQPMGTLSSWASMALVHHALELFAAWKAGVDPTTFTRYRVLGDDNVTGNCLVASSYKTVCEQLQVPISHSKTLEGKLFIFASQIYLDGKNLSPMSLKEELSVRSCSQRVEMALRAVSRGWAGDKPTLARLLRLFCRTRDYMSCVREFSNGRLGRIAQAALISAFGLGSKILSRIGFQKSGLLPFLLSIENKVQALAGDKCHLSPANLALYDEIESLIAIATSRRLIAMLKKDLDSLREAGIRWSEWELEMEEKAILPLGYKKTKSLQPWILTYPHKGVWSNLPESIHMDQVSWESWSRAIWPVLKDTYGPFFGASTQLPGISDFAACEAEDLGIGEEDLGMGITFSPTPEETVTSGGWRNVNPDIIQETRGVQTRAIELFDALVKGLEDGNPVKDAMESVNEILELKSKLPRVPTFLNVESLTPDRSPQARDEERTWVRMMKSFAAAASHLALQKDFSVLDIPVCDGVDEAGEALRSTNKELLLSFHKEKGVAPAL